MLITRNIKKNVYYIVFGWLSTVIFGILFAVIRLWLFDNQAINTEVINTGIQINPIKMIFPLLLAPIVEEIMFRKTLPALLEDFTGRKKGVMLSNVAFAIVHGDWFFFPYFVNGMIYSYSYEKTRSIIIPIAIHIFYNLFVFLQ